MSVLQQRPDPCAPEISCQKPLPRGSEAERTRQRTRREDAEGGPESGAGPQPRRTSGEHGSCLSGAPAKLQNNEGQAAKPKSGAKNPWNVRPRATGPTGCHLTEGLSSQGAGAPQVQGAVGAECRPPAWVPGVCGLPAPGDWVMLSRGLKPTPVWATFTSSVCFLTWEMGLIARCIS